MHDFVAGKLVSSTVAVESTQICSAVHTRQCVCHIKVKQLAFHI